MQDSDLPLVITFLKSQTYSLEKNSNKKNSSKGAKALNGNI